MEEGEIEGLREGERKRGREEKKEGKVTQERDVKLSGIKHFC